jgi:acetyl-CoA carboxylase carboxyl transferase subunit alpha
VIDGIVPEPTGGAHRDGEAAIRATGEAIAAALEPLSALDADALRDRRAQKFLEIGRSL